MFKENNAARLRRAGRVYAHGHLGGLWMRAIIEVAYTHGWRRGEMLDLRERQVDLHARTIRLDRGTTKNGEGREVVMTSEVEELLRAAVAKKKPTDSVFTREDSKPIKDFRGAWRNLCVRAGTGRRERRKCAAIEMIARERAEKALSSLVQPPNPSNRRSRRKTRTGDRAIT